ncbi:hypothetical protein [Thermogemmatispora sp.]|uniref:hypothetical protein n=1 Tax=Thermogemmatispora sp. TaxID=1968838 RepID=UPI001DF58289|nr:hypothetical protein [Thermogemmatispora sp.]MBX5452143.1 hypothetical protein [Thermogemmatispora sp.]
MRESHKVSQVCEPLAQDSGRRQGRGGDPWRERYRRVVSILLIPLGLIISLRALGLGWQAWTLVLLGLAFVALGIVRLQLLPPWHLAHGRARKGEEP